MSDTAKLPRNLREVAELPTAEATNYPVLKSKKLLAAVDEYVATLAQIKALEARRAELRDQVIAGMDGSPVAFAGVRTLNVATVATTPAKPDRVITKDMLGQLLRGSPARPGYKQLRVV